MSADEVQIGDYADPSRHEEQTHVLKKHSSGRNQRVREGGGSPQPEQCQATHADDRPGKLHPIKVGLLGPREARILDLAGPWEVFTRANEILAEQEPKRKPGYHLQLATIDDSDSIECFGQLYIKVSGNFRSLDPKLDTLLVGGGRAVWEIPRMVLRRAFHRTLGRAPSRHR